MLQLLLNSMFSAFTGIWTEPKKDDVSAPIPEAQEKSECAPVGKVKQNPLTDDIKRLEEAFSNGQPLESGQEINVTLQELLRIVPRNRPRKDAYRHLQRVLKDEMGVILTIKSRKDGKKKD